MHPCNIMSGVLGQNTFIQENNNIFMNFFFLTVAGIEMVAFGRFVSIFFVELLVIDFTFAYSLRFILYVLLLSNCTHFYLCFSILS